MSKLSDMARGRFKSKARRSSSRTMAKRKGRKSSRRKSSGSASGVFSGKVLGFKIPLIGDILRNKTAQKLIAGAGIVTIAGTLVGLVNNPMLNRVFDSPITKIGLAGAAGDITGIAGQFVSGGGAGQLRGLVGGRGEAQTSLVPTIGGGIA